MLTSVTEHCNVGFVPGLQRHATTEVASTCCTLELLSEFCQKRREHDAKKIDQRAKVMEKQAS
jgi:hypothetical protein